MSNAASTLAIIGSLAALIGLQTFWVSRVLDGFSERLRSIETRLDRIEARLDDMFRVLLEHGERITRLEEKVS